MQKPLKLFLILISISICIGCYPPSWIRELPSEAQELPDAELDGIFEKKLPPFSPLTSVYYKEKHSEKLKFNVLEKSFQKSYFREIEDDGIFRRIRIEGKGKYKSKGNWVLLITEKVEMEESVWKGDKQISTTGPQIVSSSHKLLYHFAKNSNSIIPMIYEAGYKEKSFGVVDGTKTPYAEDESFRIARRNFSLKEYQGHAYFKVK